MVGPKLQLIAVDMVLVVVVCIDGLSQCWGVLAALGWLDKELCLLAGMDLCVLCSIASLMLVWKIFQGLL